MLSNSTTCINYVIQSEGSEYTNDPHDPGGPTKWGITLQDVKMYLKKGASSGDVKRLTRDQAVWIYKNKYWDALNCDALPLGLDYSVFDYGVNSGLGKSGKVLRQILDLSTKTWKVDDDVLEAVKEADIENLIVRMNDSRLAYLKRLNTWRYYGKGWGRRVASVKAISLGMQNPAKRGGLFNPWPGGPARGRGKGLNLLPNAAGQRAELPLNLAMPLAACGVLLAIRNRKVD